MLELKSKQDIVDFVNGCTLLATGGGGSPQKGKDMLLRVLEEGYKIKVDSVNDMKEDSYSICPFLMGSSAEIDLSKCLELTNYELKVPSEDYLEMLSYAVLKAQQITGKKIDALVPAEVGGANSSVCLAVGAVLGMQVLDGDYSGGRAIPQMDQGTLALYNKSFVPVISVDFWGNTTVLETAKNSNMVERIGKYLSVASFGNIGNAAYLLDCEETKTVITPNTMSKCFEIGKKLRKIKENGDSVDKFIKEVGGFHIASGKVVDKNIIDNEDGYFCGYHYIEQCKDGIEEMVKVWFKNECHLCWINEKMVAASPDLITLIETKTLSPLTNDMLDKGMEVTIIGFKANDLYRSDKALKIFSPKAFSFNEVYEPIENLL